MKKYLVLLLFAAALLGCANNEVNQNPLVGNWTLTEWRTSQDKSFTPWEGQATVWSFAEDGRFALRGYCGDLHGSSYRISEVKDLFIVGNQKVLFLELEEGELPWCIVDTLSSNELVIIWEQNYYFQFKKLPGSDFPEYPQPNDTTTIPQDTIPQEDNLFYITIDSIEATSVHATVTPANTAMYYGLLLYKTEDVVTEDSLKSYLNEYVADIQSLMAMYSLSLEDCVTYEMLFKGVHDQSISGISSDTEYTFIAFEVTSTNDMLSLGKYASLAFRTKELEPEKTVALNVSKAEYYYYENYGLIQLSLEDTLAGLTMGLVLEAKDMNGTFTEDNFYSDGYVYNYVEWGKGDNDWTALQKFQMTGSFDSAKKEYTISGKAIDENLVEYTFNAKATEYVFEANDAPAKLAVKKVAFDNFRDIKKIIRK